MYYPWEENYFIHEGGKKLVQHIQFTMWPNYGVVENISQLANFVRFVHDNQKKDHPMVVHCSGGVGRSGTFTTIYSIFSLVKQMMMNNGVDTLNDHLGKNGDLCLAPLVCHLRKVRHPWMVEGLHQYFLAYQTSNFLMKQLSS